ncbi:hypothetical protein FJD32_018480 [Shewanella sp. LC6]|jgi:hypothetical protein|uniref:hypothetical protein n=1 Tax=unclassified Shewanella TaxID=196818 RepID=UPI000B51CF71|nr:MULTISPECIES: hypothetical protein [unclassified Shewanella]ASF15537.1 hypothetical protein CEQ32_11510 [Shewanella sp. FDAARGOS_354]QQK61283.1 hypothetical protein FJD32_018480 [Shewanella sp. LC6]TPE61637.1 hypothetical protein FJD33_06075 [Shewanella sp. LC2]
MAIGICRVLCTTVTLTLGLTACDNQVSDKSASIPASREYQIISTSHLNDGFETRKVLQARLLLDYQLQDTEGKAASLTTPLTHNARFFIQPNLLQISDYGMPIPVSNIDPKAKSNELAQLVKDGFNVEFNNGEVRQLTPIAKMDQKDIKELFERWQNLNNLFKQAPTLPVALEPRVGYSTSAPMDGRLTWTVEQVSEDKLIAVLQGEKGKYKAYGKFEVNRKTGWLESMAFFQREERQGSTFTHRTVMAPKDRPYIMSTLWHADDRFDAERDRDDRQKELYRISEVPQEYRPNNEAFIKSLLPDQQGILDNVGPWGTDTPEDLQLRFVHNMSPQYVEADVRYEDLSAFDANGKAIDIHFWQHGRGWARNYNPSIESATDIIATGWDNTANKLKQIDHINAKLTLIPQTNKIVEKSWDELLATPYTFGDASLTIQVLDAEAKLFKVISKQSEDQSINLPFQQFKGMIADARREGNYPSWLTATEKELLEQLIGADESHHLTSNALLLKLDETPKTVVLIEKQPQPELTQTKTIRFVQFTEYDKNLANPPTEFGNASLGSFTNPTLDSAKNEVNTIQGIKLVSDNGHNLSIPMSAALATACKPEIEQGFNEGKNPVTWQFVPNALSGSAYMLMTPDHVRQFFYDKQIKGKIRCQGDIHWQPLELAATDRPWLIDLQSWLAQTGYGNEPSSNLNNYFKVEDAQGNLLSIRLPENTELPINEVLVDGRYLSIAGPAAKVSYMTIAKEPSDIPYEFTFKPLP